MMRSTAQARRVAGVGQRELAEALGLAPQRLSDLENGYSVPPTGWDRTVREALEGILRGRLRAIRRRRSGHGSRR